MLITDDALAFAFSGLSPSSPNIFSRCTTYSLRIFVERSSVSK